MFVDGIIFKMEKTGRHVVQIGFAGSTIKANSSQNFKFLHIHVQI